MIVTILAATRSSAAEKITAVDQPGGCRSYPSGHALAYAPDAPP